MNSVKRLDWDSNFFGYEIGLLVDFENEVDLINIDQFKLIIVKSFKDDRANINFFKKLKDYSWSLVDVKCNYEFNIDEKSIKEKIVTNEFVFEKIDLIEIEELHDLAFQSGIYSRYKIDPNFKNNEFKKLYIEWIEKSILDKNTRTLVYRQDSTIKGFITYKKIDETITIGLFAVNENYRKQGIGKVLINYVINDAFNNGIKIIKVSTQIENENACFFYEKNNFKIYSKENIYHLWSTKL